MAVFALCIGAFMYYVALWRARLIPRWLSGWGVLAVVSMAIAVVLAVVADKRIAEYVPVAAPIGLQEMVMAVWLLVRGFRSVEAAAPAK